MDQDVNFKQDFPLLDKILHIFAPVVAAGVVFYVVYWFQMILWVIFIRVPFVGFAPTSVDSFPLLAYINPMWIPAGVVTFIVLYTMRRRQVIQTARFRNRNTPTTFYDEQTALDTSRSVGSAKEGLDSDRTPD